MLTAVSHMYMLTCSVSVILASLANQNQTLNGNDIDFVGIWSEAEAQNTDAMYAICYT